MKECINCKAQLEDDELFCHECGTKQEVEEVDQTEESVAIEEKYCIHCGKAIEADSAFCPFCGKLQDVEEIKDGPQKEIEKEEPQQEPVEPERVQTDEQGPVPPPKPESSEQLEQPKQPEQPKKPEAEEQPTYEWEEEKKSKNWLWILLALLIAGAALWYFFIQDSGNTVYEAQVDTDMIEEVADSIDAEAMDDGMPTSAIEFLEQFYKGKVGDADYLAENVTTNVLIKLKQDYMYDCPSNDCLAVWVFTAYPRGSDMELEEGPIISETFTKDKYRVDFRYASYHGAKQENEIRTVYLVVSEIDGKYMISNYEVENNGNRDEQEIDTPSEEVTSEMGSSAENIEKRELSRAEDNSVYDQVDQMPQFPGGPAAMFEYLSKNIRYPVVAEENGVQGKVIITFIVERDGSISNVKVVKSVDPSLNNEASRIVRSMPHWIPGKQNGANVRVKYTVPVDFKLQ